MSLIVVSSVLLISIHTLASSPFSIASLSSFVKIFPALINSFFVLLRVASLIGASTSTSASFSRLPFSSVSPVLGMLTTFFCPHSLSQRVSFLPSSVAVASFVTFHSPDQSWPSATISVSFNVIAVLPSASAKSLPQLHL